MNKSVSRRVLSFVMALAMVITTVIATPVSTQAASMKLKMSASKVTVCVGKSVTVKVKKVTGTKKKTVTYATSNKKVATVDKKGKITGKKVGKATITATLKANKKVKAKITVTVVQGTKSITTAKNVTVPVKKSITLKSTVLPTNAKNKGLKYKSSNTKIAKVDKKGKITGKKTGKTTITVSAADGCAKSVKVSVKVVKKATAVSSIKLNAKSKKVYPGKKFTLKAKVSPSKATTKSVYWLSSNPDVVTVDTKGNVKAVKSGKATITAYACDASGKKASCKVTVNTYVSSVKLNKTKAELFEGEELQLKTKISPSKATNKAVTWKSSNKEVATVSTSGKVTAVAAGTATITATAKDGSKKKASCKVTVKAKEVEPSETPSEVPSETPSEAPSEAPVVNAKFDFNDATLTADGAELNGTGAKAVVKSGCSYEEVAEGNYALVLDGKSQWLDITSVDGSSLLAGVDDLSISYDVKGAAGIWGFYAADSAKSNLEGRAEHYYAAFWGGVERYYDGRDAAKGSVAIKAPAEVNAEGWKHVEYHTCADCTKIFVDGKEVASVENEVATPLSKILGATPIFQFGKANWGEGEFGAYIIDNLEIKAPAKMPETPVEPEKPTFYTTTIEKGKDYTITYDGKEFFASSQNIERAYNQYVKNYELSDTDLFDKIDKLVTVNDVLSGATVDVAVNGNTKTVTVTRNGRTKTVTITKGSSKQGAQYTITTEMFDHTYTVVANHVSVTVKDGTSIITAKVFSPDVEASYYAKAVLTATKAEVYTCDVNADGQYVEKELVVKADVDDNGYTFGVQKMFANTIYDDLADTSEKLPADINEFIDGIGGITIVK